MSRFENGKINLETVSFRPLLFYFTREQRSGEVTGGRNEVKEVSLRWEMGKIILLGRGEEKFSGEEKLIHFFSLFYLINLSGTYICRHCSKHLTNMGSFNVRMKQ